MLQPTTLCKWALLEALLLMATASPYPQHDTSEIDLIPTINVMSGPKICIRGNMRGECVLESYCNDQHIIEAGGVIDASEFRSYGCDISKNERCCFDDAVRSNVSRDVVHASVPTVTETQGCAVTMTPSCPWCVKLYRTGGFSQSRSSGFFCMGTMVGSRVVLTAASCVLQSAKNKMWARIPNSVDPHEDYIISYRLKHPQHNSGTREYDIALLALENDVKWNNSLPKGACIGLNSSLHNECAGAGIDSGENINMTSLFVNKGSCSTRGPVIDGACGTVDNIDSCSVIAGAPVMCAVDGGAYMMAGIVRVPCRPINDGSGKAGTLLGSLNLASAWLERELQTTFRLQPSDYLHSAI